VIEAEFDHGGLVLFAGVLLLGNSLGLGFETVLLFLLAFRLIFKEKLEEILG
jgi:hypothetical protein